MAKSLAQQRFGAAAADYATSALRASARKPGLASCARAQPTPEPC
jgi:hypothetical protein